MRLQVTLVLIAGLIAGCGDPASPSVVSAVPQTPDTPALLDVMTFSLARTSWEDLQGDAALANDPAGHLYFDLSAGESQYYLWNTSAPTTLVGSISAAFTITATGGHPGFFFVEPCGTGQPTTRIFILHDWSGDYGRWWAHAPVTLGLGSFTSAVSLSDLSMWSAVFGAPATSHPAEFASALRNPLGVGLTFGSECAYGHGVGVMGGSIRFTVIRLTAG